jgi:very-short-patch-repair endonuclease
MKLHHDAEKLFLLWKNYEVESAGENADTAVDDAPDMTPIEQIVFFAIKRQEGAQGWRLTPQQRIGRYKADFVVEGDFVFSLQPRIRFVGKIVIECDGHDHHEKTKEQAAHDKKRDRAMQALGFKVFRFTGSEIVRSSGRCVTEALGCHHGE